MKKDPKYTAWWGVATETGWFTGNNLREMRRDARAIVRWKLARRASGWWGIEDRGQNRVASGTVRRGK